MLFQDGQSDAATVAELGKARRTLLDLSDRIQRLWAAEQGETFLKRLFWEELDYEQVSSPLPLSVLPPEARVDAVDCRIIARVGDMNVCHIQMREALLQQREGKAGSSMSLRMPTMGWST